MKEKMLDRFKFPDELIEKLVMLLPLEVLPVPLEALSVPLEILPVLLEASHMPLEDISFLLKNRHPTHKTCETCN